MGDDEYDYGLDGGMVSLQCTYSQTHRVVYIQHVQLLHVNHTSVTSTREVKFL